MSRTKSNKIIEPKQGKKHSATLVSGEMVFESGSWRVKLARADATHKLDVDAGHEIAQGQVPDEMGQEILPDYEKYQVGIDNYKNFLSTTLVEAETTLIYYQELSKDLFSSIQHNLSYKGEAGSDLNGHSYLEQFKLAAQKISLYKELCDDILYRVNISNLSSYNPTELLELYFKSRGIPEGDIAARRACLLEAEAALAAQSDVTGRKSGPSSSQEAEALQPLPPGAQELFGDLPPSLQTKTWTKSDFPEEWLDDPNVIRAANRVLSTYNRRRKQGLEIPEADLERVRAARRLVRTHERKGGATLG